MPSVLASRCPSEHNLIFNYFSSVILNVVDRINTAQTNVRITKVAHKGDVVFIYAKQFENSREHPVFGNKVTRKTLQLAG